MSKKFFTIDAETDPFLYGRIPEPFLWGVFDGIEYWTFTDTEKLIEFIKKEDAIFYAHNGGKFDFHLLAKYINKDEKLLMINSRLVQAKIGRAEIRDSYALLPFPLRMIGNKKDIDYIKLEKENRHKHMDEIKEYLFADCVELWQAINAFFETYGRHLTSASAAIKTLVKIENLKIPNSGQNFFNEFNPFYFGGRCQCFKSGQFKKKLTYLDINSAYPFAMMHDHPIGDKWEYQYNENPEILGHNFYTLECISNGAFCARSKSGLEFPDTKEKFVYNVTGWELIAAIKTKRISKIRHIRQKVFFETRNFKKFISHFWELRQSYPKGSHQNTFAKLMMNSAYGKFAANPENYDTYVLFDPEIAEYLVSEGWEIRGELGDGILCSIPLQSDFMRYYNVATGASITGFVRAMLLEAISKVENPIYCDTDSLIFSGECDLPLGNELGQWKIEGIFSEGYFAGKKLYALKDKKGEIKLASKGAKLTFDQIKNTSLGKEEIYKQESPIFSWYKEPKFLDRKIRKTACN